MDVQAVQDDNISITETNSPVVDKNGVIIRGTLVTRTTIMRRWVSRYFVLTKDYLTIYNSEEDFNSTGIMPIGGFTPNGYTIKNAESEFQRKFCFKIFLLDNQLYLQAKSQEEMENWIKYLKVVILNLHEANSDTPLDEIAGWLFVTVNEAKNLKNHDLFSLQDPFCKLILNDQILRTSTQNRAGAAAKWEEEFCFDIPYLAANNTLNIELWDEDVFFDDSIGKVIMPVTQFFNIGEFSSWFTVLDRRRKISGEISLSFKFKFNPMFL